MQISPLFYNPFWRILTISTSQAQDTDVSSEVVHTWGGLRLTSKRVAYGLQVFLGMFIMLGAHSVCAWLTLPTPGAVTSLDFIQLLPSRR